MKEQIVDSSQVSLPEKWIDFTRDELLMISKARMSGEEPHKWMPQLIIKILGITSKSIKFENQTFYYTFVDTQKRDVFLTSIGVVGLMNRLDWVFSSVNLMLEPKIKGYKSPNFKLQHITLEDFIKLDELFSKALNSQNKALMNQFCSMIYKPNTNFCPTLTENQKFAILFWYIGFKAWLKEKYPYVFSTNEDYEEDSEELSIEEIIIPLLSALNAGHAVDNDKLRKGKMHELFYELNKQIQINSKK